MKTTAQQQAIDDQVRHAAAVFRASIFDFIEFGPMGAVYPKRLADIPLELRIIRPKITTRARSLTIEMPDKLAAVEVLMKHLGGYRKHGRPPVRFVVVDVDPDVEPLEMFTQEDS